MEIAKAFNLYNKRYYKEALQAHSTVYNPPTAWAYGLLLDACHIRLSIANPEVGVRLKQPKKSQRQEQEDTIPVSLASSS